MSASGALSTLDVPTHVLYLQDRHVPRHMDTVAVVVKVNHARSQWGVESA